MEYLVLMRTVNPYSLRRAVVCNLVIEGSQLRYLDEVAETLLRNDVVRYVELEVGGLLGEDGSPCVKTPYNSTHRKPI